MSIKFYKAPSAAVEVIYISQMTVEYPCHTHMGHLTVGLVMDGCLEIEMGDERHSFHRGMTFLIGLGLPHALVSKMPCTFMALIIEAEMASQIKEAHCFNVFEKLMEPIRREVHIEASMVEALWQCLNRYDRAETHGRYDHLQREILERADEAVGLNELMEMEYMSKYHLIRTFKKEVGLTPKQLKLQKQIRTAQSLISEGIEIAEVAQMTGFYDQSHFSKQFKKVVRLTPKTYRQSLVTVKPNRGFTKVPE